MRAPRIAGSVALLVFCLAGSATAGERAGGGGPVAEAVRFVRQLLRLDSHAVHHHSISLAFDAAALVFEGDARPALTIATERGHVLIAGDTVGHYRPGGPFDASWHELVHDLSRRSTAEAVDMLRHWAPEGLPEEERDAAARVRQSARRLRPAAPGAATPQAVPPAGPTDPVLDLSRLHDVTLVEPMLLRVAGLTGPDLRLTVTGGQARLGDFSIGSGESMTGHLLVVRGTADVYGRLGGNLVTVDGDVVVHPGAVVTGDVLAYRGHVHDLGGEIGGEIRTFAPQVGPDQAPPPVHDVAPAASLPTGLRHAAGLLGVFLTLAALGFGLVMFGRPNLEVVSDTVSHSFGRAFVVGLLGEMLLLPTFGMLVVGLVLSVVGILLLPFAVVAYALLVVVALLGGFLATAHAMGETYTRRRMVLGTVVASPNSYRYVLIGLGAIMVFWAAWVLFGWVPVAGSIIWGVAVLVTWLLATAGFGAALLSRAGIREHFAGRFIPPEALTDEFLWATPQFGVPAVKRPGRPAAPER